MTVVIDTRSVAPEDRREFWEDVVSRVYHPLIVEPPPDRGLSARVAREELCGIGVCRLESSGLASVRTPRRIAELDPETVTVMICVKGRFGVVQDGRTAVCEPGDLSSCNSSTPHTIRSFSPIEAVTYTIPRSLLGPYADRVSAQTATRVRPAGAALLVGSFLLELARSIEGGEVAANDPELAEAVLTLVRRLASSSATSTGPGDAELLLRIKAYIAANLSDPDLDPETIAHAHYISRRHLYNVFKPEQCGVHEWIQRQRLAGAARDLRDPKRREEPIFAIAARWGFRSLSHFSRAFRDAHGCSPREYRAGAARLRAAQNGCARPPSANGAAAYAEGYETPRCRL